MAPSRSVTVAVTSPRSCARARAWPGAAAGATEGRSTRKGTNASVSSVRRSEIWLKMNRVTATTTRFWNKDTSEAVMTVLVWSTSVMIPDISCAGAGALEEPQIQRQQVAEEPGAQVAHQPFLCPDGDLSGGIAQCVLEHQPGDQEHDQAGGCLPRRETRPRAGSTRRSTRASSWVEPGPQLAGGTEQVLKQRDQQDQREAIEQGGQQRGHQAEREQAPVGPRPAAEV